MKTTSVGAVAATLAVAAALLAGCQSRHATASPQRSQRSTTPASSYNGVEALHADEILHHARTALRQAKSYHVNGEYTDRGGKVTLDFTVVGKDFDGSIVSGKSKMELRSVGGEQYFRPTEQSWAAPVGTERSAAPLVGARWFKVPAGNKDFADLFSTADIDGPLQFDGSLTKGGPSTVDGVSTIAVLENGNPVETLYVARIGEPYPIRMATAEGSILRLTRFGDAASSIEKPPADQILILPAPNGK